MSISRISAEIEPVEGEARAAASRLMQLGFTVHDVGRTISVEGSKTLWEEVFPVEFERADRSSMQEIEDARTSYYRPTTENVEIPTGLEELIEAVHFQEPPELFGTTLGR